MRHFESGLRKKLAILLGATTVTFAAVVAWSHEPERAVPVTDIVLERPASATGGSPARSADQRQPSSKSLRIAVPFTPQAPFANWEPPFDEACEEASLLMVHHFLQQTPLSKEQAEREIVAMVAWEADHGIPIDATIDEVALIAREYYGYRTRVFEAEDVTKERLLDLLAAGNPIIIPAAGQMLGNPYFSGRGPPYHMLVIVGFDDKNFIVHDPGTKRGENYIYRQDVLLGAIHDWTGVKEEIRSGPKRMLIVKPRNS